MTFNILIDDLKDGTCFDREIGLIGAYESIVLCGLKDNCPAYPPTLTLLEAESSDDDVNWLLWGGIGAAGLVILVVIVTFVIKGS